ncbi:uncharacterized protein [Antedon mediterranea]|uniref:uncharacterized protein isoform X2 n=1 Tax=Antedon mediterranea TaxID=105859 RepID=UPI003AF4216F
MDVNAWRSSLGLHSDKKSQSGKNGAGTGTEGPVPSVPKDQPTSSTTRQPPQDIQPADPSQHKVVISQKPVVSRQTLIVNAPPSRQQSNIPTTRTPMFVRAPGTTTSVPISHVSTSKHVRPIQVRPLQPSDLRMFKSSQIIRNPVQSTSMITNPPITIPHTARHQVISMNSPRIQTIVRYPHGRAPRPTAITSYQRQVMLTSSTGNPLPSNTVRGNPTVAVAIPIQSPPTSHIAYQVPSTARPKHVRVMKSPVPLANSVQIRPRHLLRPVKPIGYSSPRSSGFSQNLDPFMVIRTTLPPTRMPTGNVVSTPHILHNTPSSTRPSTSTSILQNKNRVKDLPHAIVKPQVLTHIIDGFVIEEASEPFPITRSAIVEETLPEKTCKTQSNGHTAVEEKKEDDLLKCEFCGKMDAPNKFKRSKRFCSMACAKRYNVGCSKRLGLFKPKRLNVERLKHNMKMKKRAAPLKGVRVKHGRLAFNTQRPEKGKDLEHLETPQLIADDIEEEDELDDDEDLDEVCKPEEPMDVDESSNSATLSEGAMSSSTPSEDATFSTPRNASPTSELEPAAYSDKEDIEEESEQLPTQPSQWTPQQVSNFINAIPGCKDYANEFLAQEIDGQALMLLKEDLLMTAMNMKLGPALKIISKIHSLKDK